MQDERYLETIEMLAATIAHEVKNPLALIQANIDYIELCDTSKQHAKSYGIIREELRKTNEMVSGFIDFVKVAYHIEEDIVMYDAVLNVIENYEKNLAKNIVFSVNCQNKNLFFKGNLQLFTMALSNMVKNATEAVGDKGEIDFLIAENGEWLKLTIKDNGPGVTQEALEKINNSQSYTSKSFGSGVGVHICKNIVKEHSGIFEMKNGTSGGCIVDIKVPKGVV